MHGKADTLKCLLTGRPGCGKTTAVIELARLLTGRNIAGFYIQEVRRAGQRSGCSRGIAAEPAPHDRCASADCGGV